MAKVGATPLPGAPPINPSQMPNQMPGQQPNPGFPQPIQPMPNNQFPPSNLHVQPQDNVNPHLLPCQCLDTKKVCGRVRCKNHHKIPGTHDQTKNTYLIVHHRQKKELNLQLN